MSKKAEKMKTHSIATLRQIAKGGGLSSVAAEYELKRRGLSILDDAAATPIPEEILDEVAA